MRIFIPIERGVQIEYPNLIFTEIIIETKKYIRSYACSTYRRPTYSCIIKWKWAFFKGGMVYHIASSNDRCGVNCTDYPTQYLERENPII